MDKSNRSQILKLSLIATLLVVTPVIPTSLRSTYLYFVFNLLIIALGAEAGLLSFFSNVAEDKKPQPNNVALAAKPMAALELSPEKEGPENASGRIVTDENSPNKPKVVEKCSSEKIVGVTKAHKVRKCRSTPSIFFIGSGETEKEEVIDDDDDNGGAEAEEEVGVLSGQELFTKAETFIGNFYRQLKMQREDSWNRIHGFYPTAFCASSLSYSHV
ncbi:hypothetical protein NMG60_11037305 [Bertholletia excelsa]